ncbi:Rz-like spanin [Escherichia phage UFV-AREG1]|uniref:Spanin Rz n=1 Tax=Escherichia phage UFV-AREG1 TaxID=1837867 RepID=A0A173GAM7_9CAUD|nr:Rz-like spanin [Escherichia phage UFV-AREG1]ANH50357.1 hypothetical protein AREG1_00226 [Escherichia phage UFV-AREG1]
MQLSNTTAGLLLIVIALGGTSLILKNKIERLETSVVEITKTANENALALNDLKNQYNYIDAMNNKNREAIAAIERENEKLRKDAKKADVVASKPGLVEKQINSSFSKFAEDIQDLSK